MALESSGSTQSSQHVYQNLLESQAFNPTFFNSIRDAIVVVNHKGTILFSNQSAQSNLEFHIGSQLETVLPEFWPNVGHTLKDAVSRTNIKVKAGEFVFRTKIIPFPGNAKPQGVVCVFENSTEFEKITSQLISSQELSNEFDAIFNSCSDGLWICDGGATVIRINKSSERINNIRAEDVVGRNMRDLLKEGFIDRSGTLEALKSKSTVNLIQYMKDGTKLMITAIPVYDEQGRLFRVVVNEKDITEIESLHNELKEQTAIRDRFRNQMLEMQLAELESTQIIARSPCFVNVLQQAIKVSAVDSSVLILGESGSGKGLLADLIHKYSKRAGQPMIKINCGAIPESLVESELFGYEKGAFTGAHKDGKPGYFELADGGILFLDEIVELPMSSQVKLLRFLEDGHIRRIGGTISRKIDVRIIAATNRDTETAVAQGEFRLDLYYRLNVIPISIPPLRERKDCILPLFQHYTDYFVSKLGLKKKIRFTRKATDALLGYSYPGNVRELMNLCERLVVMSERNKVDVADLPNAFHPCGRLNAMNSDALSPDDSAGTLQEILENTEREVLARAIERYGTQTKVSMALGVNQSTIARKLKKYGLNRASTTLPHS